MEEEYAEELKSKSQIKRELLAIKELGAELVTLSNSELEKLPVSATTFSAIQAARAMKKGALKRQLQYIGKLMRNEDPDAIKSTLEALRKPRKEDVTLLHQLESWRDRLVEGDDELLEELIGNYPDIDRQYLRQLVRNGSREKQQNKGPKAARVLFQYLKSLTTSTSSD